MRTEIQKEEIAEWESLLKETITNLNQVRLHMTESAIPHVILHAKKFEDAIAFARAWSMEAEMKTRQQINARKHARKILDEVNEERAKKKKRN